MMGFLFGESLTANEPFTSSLSVSGMSRYTGVPIIPYPGYKVQPRQKYGGQGPAHNELSINKTFIACPVGPKDPTGSRPRSLYSLNALKRALSPKMKKLFSLCLDNGD